MEIPMDINHTVGIIVETMLPRQSGRMGLIVRFEIDMEVFGKNDDEGDFNHRGVISLLFLRENNYTRVLFRKGINKEILNEDIYGFFGKETEWTQSSYHDSCWRTDGIRVVADFYNDMKNNLAGFSPHCYFRLDNNPVHILVDNMEKHKKEKRITFSVKLNKHKFDMFEAAKYIQSKKDD